MPRTSKWSAVLPQDRIHILPDGGITDINTKRKNGSVVLPEVTVTPTSSINARLLNLPQEKGAVTTTIPTTLFNETMNFLNPAIPAYNYPSTMISQDAPKDGDAFLDFLLWSPVIKPTIARLGNGLYKGVSLAYNNVLDYSAAKQFVQRYEYPYKIKPSIVFNGKKLDKLYDRLIHQHNTFARGVDPYEAIKFGRFPAGTTPEDAARYSLTHVPKATVGNVGGLTPGENALYTSNSIGLAQAYTNGNGYIGLVQRPIKPMSMFDTRRRALYENDFLFLPIPGNTYSSTTDYPKAFKYARAILRRKKEAFAYGGRYYMPKYPRINNGSVVRANAGAFPVPNTNRMDKDFRHYLFVGNEGEQPVNLLHMYPWSGKTRMSDYNYTSVGLSHKK